MSYCTYYISKFAVTARVLLAINVVLLTIQFNSYVHEYLPPSEKSTWLEEFLRGVMIFACISMLEFVVLNFCTCQYMQRKEMIDTILTEIRANMSRVKRKFMKIRSEKEVKNAIKKLLD